MNVPTPRTVHRARRPQANAGRPHAKVEEHFDGEWTVLTAHRTQLGSSASETKLASSCSSAVSTMPLEHVPCIFPSQLVPLAAAPCTAEDFIIVPETLSTVSRAVKRQRPVLACAVLWAWIALLLAGEFATTVLWFHSLGLQGLCALAAPVVFAACIALIFLCPGQVLAMALSAMLAAMPGLPAYSAVLLMMPHTASESPWEAIHWASLAVLGVLYLAATLVPLLRAEHPKPGCVVRFAVAALEAAQRLARGVCIVAAWVFTAVLLDAAGGASFGWAQQHLVVQSEAAWGFWSAGLLGLVTSGRGLVLFLHVLGLLCTEARQHTVDSLGHEMLPLLLGTNRARALSLEALVKDHGRRFLRRIPTLRRWTPPKTFVALAVTLRRTAVIVFPALAFLPHLAGQSLTGACLSWILGLGLIALVVATMVSEWKGLPNSPLRQLPLLLPSGITPGTRKMLGYVLVAAEVTEVARKRATSLRRRIRANVQRSI